MGGAETGSARLVRAGAAIDPGDLAAHAAPIDPARLPALRDIARQSGRVIEHDGLLVLSLLEAARIELPGGLADKDSARDALGLLRGIPVTADLPAARGPIALGALPFSGASPATFVVPGVAVVVAPGHDPVATAVAPLAELRALLGRFPFTATAAPEVRDEVAPDQFSLVSVRSHEDYRQRVRDAVAAIGNGELEKVVLAREVSVEANRDFPRGALVARLRQLHPSCATYAIDGFVGASPELLLRRTGSALVSQPLAGTIGRSGDPDEDARLARALLASDKDRAEHRFVVDAIVAGLTRIGADVAPVGQPHLLELRNVVHLATRVEAFLALDDQGFAPGVLDVVAVLHPTPAVGGVPRDAALEYLAREEALDRSLYAGPVGWFDRNGDGEFYLGIRCAMLDGRRARLIAGAGIVEGSDPDLELAETQLKLQALLAAAVRP